MFCREHLNHTCDVGWPCLGEWLTNTVECTVDILKSLRTRTFVAANLLYTGPIATDTRDLTFSNIYKGGETKQVLSGVDLGGRALFRQQNTDFQHLFALFLLVLPTFLEGKNKQTNKPWIHPRGGGVLSTKVYPGTCRWNGSQNQPPGIKMTPYSVQKLV